jgi:hypothetical protein
MKFIVRFTASAENFEPVRRRFLETGGPPPEGVKMLGRWIAVDGSGGIVIAETNEAKALYAWTAEWSDLLEFETTPCVEDAEAGAVLAAVKR